MAHRLRSDSPNRSSREPVNVPDAAPASGRLPGGDSSSPASRLDHADAVRTTHLAVKSARKKALAVKSELTVAEARRSTWQRLIERLGTAMVTRHAVDTLASENLAADVAEQRRLVEQVDRQRQENLDQLNRSRQRHSATAKLAAKTRQAIHHAQQAYWRMQSARAQVAVAAQRTSTAQRATNAVRALMSHAVQRLRRWTGLITTTRQSIAWAQQLDVAVRLAARLQGSRTAVISAVTPQQRQVDQASITAQAARAAVAKQRKQVELIRDTMSGIATSKLGQYLARAPAPNAMLIRQVHAEALAEGQHSAGRPAGRGSDPAEGRTERAAKALARRLDPERCTPPANTPANLHVPPPVISPPATATPDPAVDGSRPQRRNHEEAMQAMPSALAWVYRQRLDESRRIGHAAAVADAVAGRTAKPILYQAPHAAINLPGGARLIAVRGGDPLELMERMQTDPQGMEKWLAEPALRRNAKLGKKARLTHVAGAVVAAWAPTLFQLAQNGVLDEAFACQVDLFVARMGLEGCRVCAFLHLDSVTGHPHLHLSFSRVRDADGALWSMEGRQRAAALWFHARSNTARLRGADALLDDVDALGVTSPASFTAQLMMGSQTLFAERHLLDGTTERIPLQGYDAAQRVSTVGVSEHSLAGGIWLFGTGADPGETQRWNKAVQHANAANNPTAAAQLHKLKPKARGYWLQVLKSSTGRYELRYSENYGWYLMRIAA